MAVGPQLGKVQSAAWADMQTMWAAKFSGLRHMGCMNNFQWNSDKNSKELTSRKIQKKRKIQLIFPAQFSSIKPHASGLNPEVRDTDRMLKTHYLIPLCSEVVPPASVLSDCWSLVQGARDVWCSVSTPVSNPFDLGAHWLFSSSSGSKNSSEIFLKYLLQVSGHYILYYCSWLFLRVYLTSR